MTIMTLSFDKKTPPSRAALLAVTPAFLTVHFLRLFASFLVSVIREPFKRPRRISPHRA